MHIDNGLIIDEMNEASEYLTVVFKIGEYPLKGEVRHKTIEAVRKLINAIELSDIAMNRAASGSITTPITEVLDKISDY